MLTWQRHFHETVTVAVGSGNNSASFTVHTSVIKGRSTFFESALSGRWETDRKSIELPEDDPAVFDLYLQCLYRNDGSVRLDHVDQGQCDSFSTYGKSAQEEVFDLYARVWILADKLGDCKSANLLIVALLFDILDVIEVPTPRTIAYIWARTRDGSPLRKLCVECWLYLTPDDEDYLESRVAGTEQLLPYDFLVSIINETGRLRCEAKAPHGSLDKAFNVGSLEKDLGRLYQYDHLCPKPKSVKKRERMEKERKHMENQ